MGVNRKENHNPPRTIPTSPPPHNSDDESNQTMPIQAMEHLALTERAISIQTSASQYNFKNKPIRKKLRRTEYDSKERLKQKVYSLSKRVEELQEKLREARRLEESCPHCHFYLTQPRARPSQNTPQIDSIANYQEKSPSRDSLQFQKIDFQAPLMYSAEMQQKSWIFLGTVLIAMGSKVMDTDGTMNVFKIVKQSVDQIRRQVQKSQQKLSLTFFMRKEEIECQGGMNELGFDPFYTKQEDGRGLQLQSVRVESVQEYDLYFDQKVTFNVKYDALITAMEYMKENSSLTFN